MLNLQVLENVAGLASARKNQYAAFIRDEAVLVIWADTVDGLIPAAAKLEKALIGFIWSTDSKSGKSRPALFAEADPLPQALTPEEASLATAEAEDPEKALWMRQRRERPVVLITPVVAGLAAGFMTFLLGLALRESLTGPQGPGDGRADTQAPSCYNIYMMGIGGDGFWSSRYLLPVSSLPFPVPYWSLHS